MKGKTRATNATRMLENEEIDFAVLSYPTEDGLNDGISVAAKISRPAEMVFKTLVARGASGTHYVFVIPVAEELDLKKAAKVTDEKKIDLIPVKEIFTTTGYIKGGCSPVGMKRPFSTYLDLWAETLERIVVSAGEIGLQIELSPADLVGATKAGTADLTAV